VTQSNGLLGNSFSADLFDYWYRHLFIYYFVFFVFF
jgi:hypothetical protein